MITRGISRLAATLAGSALLTAPLGAQAIALTGGGAPRPPALAASYHLILTSTWPETGEPAGCGNGGNEVVEGTLTRSASDRYAGTFTRRTRLRFCGAHGASDQSCAVVLRGEGEVAATGTVMEDGQSPSGRVLQLTWIPQPGHAAQTEGACAAGFKRKLEALYLSVRHGVEFPLPGAGAAPRTERPDGYAWTIAIE